MLHHLSLVHTHTLSHVITSFETLPVLLLVPRVDSPHLLEVQHGDRYTIGGVQDGHVAPRSGICRTAGSTGSYRVRT